MQRKRLLRNFATMLFGPLLLIGSALAQPAAHRYRFCPAGPDEPAPRLKDGDGDGKANDFLMLPPVVFKDTVLEEWCIDGGRDGHYIALKVDGKPNQNFKLIGKCSWEKGDNSFDFGGVSSNAFPLTHNVIFKSTDRVTGKYWKYTYHPDLGSIVAEKFDSENKLIKAETFMAKTQPFKYSDLPGDGDPTVCMQTQPPPSRPPH
jgi:hypothetical protein